MKPSMLLEQLAAGVMVLVIVSLGWIMLVAARPDWTWLRLATIQSEVLLVLGLLLGALLLVSIVALLQTDRNRL